MSIILIEVILISGCIDNNASYENNGSDNNSLSNITATFKEFPEVRYFLSIYPNASVTTSSLNTDNRDILIRETNSDHAAPKALYMVSICEENSSIVSWFDEENHFIETVVKNPPLIEDMSERIISYNKLNFNILKIESTIYVTYTGGQDADKVDFFVVNGYNALGHQFESQILGKEDGKTEDINYSTVRLEGACSSCWKNFVMIFAAFTNGEREVVLKAYI